MENNFANPFVCQPKIDETNGFDDNKDNIGSRFSPGRTWNNSKVVVQSVSYTFNLFSFLRDDA